MLLSRPQARHFARGALARPRPDVPSVLVAVDDAGRRRVRRMLAAWRLTFVHTRRQLGACLGVEAFDLVLIGSHFDSGQATRALQLVRQATPSVPVICAITRPLTAAAPWTYSAFRSACLALGAYDTLDFTRWRDDAHGDAHLRALLESVLR